MDRLANKTIVITGAAQGLGEAQARMCVRHGAKVILTDINATGGAALAEELGERAFFVEHDVTDPEAWVRVIAQGEARFGLINGLVNNAGITGPNAGLLEISEADYLRVCMVNQFGVFHGMRAVIPSMLQAGGGSIVNISSICGIAPVYGTPNAAYVASKFAVRGMTKCVAVEYGHANIRVNSVHPGFTRTPMMVATTGGSGGDAVAHIPARRLSESWEVANLVVFLASDESPFITGAEYVIDGGMSLSPPVGSFPSALPDPGG